jgi:hypothetical protein
METRLSTYHLDSARTPPGIRLAHYSRSVQCFQFDVCTGLLVPPSIGSVVGSHVLCPSVYRNDRAYRVGIFLSVFSNVAPYVDPIPCHMVHARGKGHVVRRLSLAVCERERLEDN